MLADLDGADRLGHDGPCNRCCVAQANQILEWRLFDISIKHFSRADLTCATRLITAVAVYMRDLSAVQILVGAPLHGLSG